MGKRLRLAYSESPHEEYKQLLCRNDKNQMKISASIQGNMREKSPPFERRSCYTRGANGETVYFKTAERGIGMKKKKRCMLAWLLTLAMVMTGVNLPEQLQKAQAAEDPYATTTRVQHGNVNVTVSNQDAPSNDWSGFNMTVSNNTGQSICDWIIVLSVPSGTAASFKCWNATFTADGDTIYLYPMQNGSNAVIAPGNMSAYTPGGGFGGKYVDASGIKVTNVYYNYGSAAQYDYSGGDTNDDTGGTGGSTGSGSSAADSTTNKDLEVIYNYAKLLQESLYFYDANMCGPEVGEKSGLSWRDACHTADQNVSWEYGGKKYSVDVSGGFHDAGDHVKFGLPQGYTATALGLSYLEFKEAYTETQQANHLKTITDYFCDYFKRSTVYTDNDKRTGGVVGFCYQVGEGGSDHSYWGPPEEQTTDRPAYFASASNPATDEVSVAIAALAVNYINFGNEEDLQTAKDLFAFVQKNSKSCATEGTGGFYDSASWQDDYSVAAAALYAATKENSYLSEYNSNKSGINTGWILDWANTGVMGAILAEDWNIVSQIAGNKNSGTVLDGVFNCLNDWGSCRYNAGLQFCGLAYDRQNNTNKFSTWADSQMKYMLGDNPNKRCYVVGYNENSSKYPHHRAASRSSDANQVNANHYTLVGALVGGPKQDGTYIDNQGDYQCNEVALDYNAGLVGAAAGLYLARKGSTDSDYSEALASEETLKAFGVTTYYGDGKNVEITNPTSRPRVSSNPSGGDQPTVSGNPSGGDQPTVSGSPSGGDQPTVSGNPSGGNQPTASGNPSGSNPSSTSSPLPTSSANPGGSNVGTGNGTGGTGTVPTISPTPTGGNNPDTTIHKKPTVKLKKKVLRVKKGKKVKIQIKKKMPGDKVKKYKIIGKKKIVKVTKKGVVKGRRKGRVTIKVIMKSGASARCKVIVK